MIIQGQVQSPSTSNPDGSNPNVLQGKFGDVIVSELHGKYYTQTMRGNVFYGSTTNAGTAIPADNATAPTFALWNPLGSGKLCVPILYTCGIVTLGTRVVSAIGFDFILNAGSQVATGGPITAFTDTASSNCLIGGGTISKMKFGLAATVTATANFLWTGIAHDLAAGGSPPVMKWDFDGIIVLPPGMFMYTVSADAATGSTYAQSIVWEEVPV